MNILEFYIEFSRNIADYQSGKIDLDICYGCLEALHKKYGKTFTMTKEDIAAQVEKLREVLDYSSSSSYYESSIY